MTDYMDSLERVKARGFDVLWPTHGPPILEVTPFIEAYAAHRRAREAQVLGAVGQGFERIVDMVPTLYADVDPRLHPAAARSVLGHMIDLVRRGKVTTDGEVILDGDAIARRAVLTGRDEYRSAFLKGVSQTSPAFSPEEVRALNEFRAQSVGTTTAGGFAVPVVIDPTIILTTGAADAPILRVARVETITNNVWKGVTGAPAAWSYDAESAAVSDDTITIGQPVVTTHMARAFIPYTIEIEQDWPSFASEMAGVIAQGYVDLIASQSMTGSGTAPQGIFTAIDANAAREVIVVTSGALSAIDVLTAWNHVPERYRSRSSWFSSVSVESKVRVPATDISGLYTVDLNSEGLGLVNGRPYYTTDYAPAFTGTTGTVNLLVVGDFSNFVIAQRAGMNIELVPHLVDVTNNRPTGERGWFAWARHGFDSVNDNAFALLKNAT
jgi:HK97 family phage major capsid protein